MKTENQNHFVTEEAHKIKLWLSSNYWHVYSNFDRPKP